MLFSISARKQATEWHRHGTGLSVHTVSHDSSHLYFTGSMPHGALFAIVVRARKHEGIEAVFDVPCKSNHEIILACKALELTESADRRVIEGKFIFKGELFHPQNPEGNAT